MLLSKSLDANQNRFFLTPKRNVNTDIGKSPKSQRSELGLTEFKDFQDNPSGESLNPANPDSDNCPNHWCIIIHHYSQMETQILCQ